MKNGKSRKANRKFLGIARAEWKKGAKKATPTNQKGPSSTTPKHGKKNRKPYIAGHPSRKIH